ncbi:hypothetical protein GGR55DRAFT_242071 [Xylaria sp. FL0064]|nr:hypothetical protein GGR55DRAFT_242071 [Xylaria sp. FL0064]
MRILGSQTTSTTSYFQYPPSTTVFSFFWIALVLILFIFCCLQARDLIGRYTVLLSHAHAHAHAHAYASVVDPLLPSPRRLDLYVQPVSHAGQSGNHASPSWFARSRTLHSMYVVDTHQTAPGRWVGTRPVTTYVVGQLLAHRATYESQAYVYRYEQSSLYQYRIARHPVVAPSCTGTAVQYTGIPLLGVTSISVVAMSISRLHTSTYVNMRLRPGTF